MLILPNEWILDYLTPGTSKSQLSEEFLRECRRKRHTLLVRRQSNFRSKLFRYSKLYPNLEVVRQFVSLSLRDLTLFRIVEENEISAANLELTTIPADDRYLVEVLYSFPAAVLVTTDHFLQQQVVALGLKAVLFQNDIPAALAAIENFKVERL